MKTTVDIPDTLFRQLKKRAATDGTSMRSMITAALRQFLSGGGGPQGRPKPFKLKDCSFKGEGVQPGIDLANWDQMAQLAYEGRGGVPERQD